MRFNEKALILLNLVFQIHLLEIAYNPKYIFLADSSIMLLWIQNKR